ncbi:MAG: glycoside hydrolase family 97 catalytic domain-containing protein [Kiritimatiellae bacterium]|nr:glycoside hydrolase family 97 catalytic domain-containing protein [Kiritimatiellia bacterium]
MMILCSLLAATISVTTPSGEPVCRVTPPDLAADTVIETTNLTGGVAWRIRYSGASRKVTNEEWTFDFGHDFTCWPVSHAQGEYVPLTLSTIANEPRPDYVRAYPGTSEGPLVIEGNGWVAALGDAGVLDYSRIRFASGTRQGQVKTVLEGTATVKPPYVTPWRYLRVAKDCVDLANGQPAFMDALNEPSRIDDTSWIKPGKVLRVSKLGEASGKACVDFVLRNHFQYIELDAGWYGPERTGDPLKPNDYVKPVIDYANARGVGVILYVNDIPLHKNRDAILDLLVSWGVKGVKYGFVKVGGQAERKWVLDAIKAAAERHLLVDIHDEYRLTGIQKTYPNVLTVEGICGNEEMPCAAHNAALPFTRFLDGPGDYTPCWNIGRIKNTLAHQLAMPCVYSSGFQFLFWYQQPEQIKENPALDFWREIPATFDETRFLQGKIGAFAVVARRVGNRWYVGALNAGEKRSFSVPLAFAGKAKLKVRLFRDADPDNTKPCAAVTCDTFLSDASDALTVSAAANGGFAAIIEPADTATPF